jgi:hypothetical protein
MNETKPPVPVPASVSVVDINMPFGSMIVFMIKWALAAIPAILILSFILGVVAVVFGTALAGVIGLGRAGSRQAGQIEESSYVSTTLTLTFHRTPSGITTVTNDSDQDRTGCSARLSDGSAVQLPALRAHETTAASMVSSKPEKVQCGGTDARIYWIQ